MCNLVSCGTECVSLLRLNSRFCDIIHFILNGVANIFLSLFIIKIMKWTEEYKNLLIKYHNEGLNSFQIAEKLNCTRKKVTSKLRSLGINVDLKKSYQHLIKTKSCLCCNNSFNYKKEPKGGRKFCSLKCSSLYNQCKISKDGVYIKKTGDNKNCLHCLKTLNFNNKTKRQSKFCDNLCQANFRKSEIFKKIESGDLTLNTKQYKNYLIHKHGEKCMECGWCEKNIYSNKIPIEIEHIDGNSENNELKNLKLLCPNCHSLTPTYKALNVGNGRHKRRERYKKGKSF